MLIQTIEAFRPEPTVVFHPVGDVLERARPEPARPPLRIAAARDQAGALEHSQVLGYGGKTHGEGLGQLGDGDFAGCEAGENGAPGGIREGCEADAETVGCHRIGFRIALI